MRPGAKRASDGWREGGGRHETRFAADGGPGGLKTRRYAHGPGLAWCRWERPFDGFTSHSEPAAALDTKTGICRVGAALRGLSAMHAAVGTVRDASDRGGWRCGRSRRDVRARLRAQDEVQYSATGLRWSSPTTCWASGSARRTRLAPDGSLQSRRAFSSFPEACDSSPRAFRMRCLHCGRTSLAEGFG